MGDKRSETKNDETETSQESSPETSQESSPETNNEKPVSSTPTPTQTHSTVKVDLTDLKDLLEGLPEKTAAFIKEAVTTPKKNIPAKKTETSTENAPQQPQNDTPKQSARKRGWLARGLFGE